MKNKILVSTLLLIGGSVFSQTDLKSDTFKVVKEYQPTLINANKISSEPEIDDDLKIDLDLDYSFISKQVPVSFQVEPIKAARIKGEPLVKLYNGYARIGVGNSLVPFGELYYNNSRSKEYSIGGHAQYFNMVEGNSIKGLDNSQMHFEVFGKRFWKRNTLTSKVSFDRQNFNYYGYYNLDRPVNQQELPKNQLEQHYNKIGFDLGLASTKQDSFNIRHSGNIAYNQTGNSSGNQEYNVRFNGNVKQFKNNELYNLDVILDYNQYDFNQDNTIIGLRPQISTIGEKFRINAGLGVYVNAANSADFHFYPLAEIKYNVIDDILVPYLGVNGQIERVNYGSLTTENLFVAEDINFRNTNEKYNLYAGLRGTLSKKFSFNLSGSLRKTDDAYLYVQQPNTNGSLSKEYFLVFDEIQELGFKGEFAYTVNDKLKIYGLANYTSYSQEEQQEAWHKPELKASVSASYNLKSKILVKADLIYFGEQFARGEQVVNQTLVATNDVEYNVVKLDGIFDANLNVEYRYTKRLSAFVQFNNIAGINYEKYKDYPTQGFNVWGGFTYGF